jgi:hypothetical protein
MYESEHVNEDDVLDDGIDALVDAVNNDDTGSTELLAHVTKQKPFAKPVASNNTPSSDIRKVLSTGDGAKPIQSEFNVIGKLYCLVITACAVYRVIVSTNQYASLIDQGANGGVAGDDKCIICKT